jgi:uncharacterized membrane-anchored protein YjiN (DUF445 family)
MTQRTKAALALIIGLLLFPALLWAEAPSQQPKQQPQPQQQQQPKQQPRPIKERPIYTSAVEKLKLDAKQAKAFEKIIEKADKKIKESIAAAKDDNARREAFRTYIADVYGQLKTLLRPDQQQPYETYMQELKQYFQSRQQKNG